MKNVLAEKDFLQIENRIHLLNDASQRYWGKMTVSEMLAPCADQIRLALGQKEPHQKPTFINRNITKYVGLWLPVIPLKNLKGPVDMDQQYYGTASADIVTEKLNLLTLLVQVRGLSEQVILLSHPMFGKLSRSQWGRFMYVHIDHHLRQFDV